MDVFDARGLQQSLHAHLHIVTALQSHRTASELDSPLGTICQVLQVHLKRHL